MERTTYLTTGWDAEHGSACGASHVGRYQPDVAEEEGNEEDATVGEALYTITEAAVRLGLTTVSVEDAFYNNQLRGQRIAASGQVGFTQAELDAWVEAGKPSEWRTPQTDIPLPAAATGDVSAPPPRTEPTHQEGPRRKPGHQVAPKPPPAAPPEVTRAEEPIFDAADLTDVAGAGRYLGIGTAQVYALRRDGKLPSTPGFPSMRFSRTHLERARVLRSGSAPTLEPLVDAASVVPAEPEIVAEPPATEPEPTAGHAGVPDSSEEVEEEGEGGEEGMDLADLLHTFLPFVGALLKARERATAREHPLLAALWKTLPEPGMLWPRRKQRAWVQAAEATLALVYRDEGDGPPPVPPSSDEEG